MDKQAFLRLADTCLDALADALETFDPDEVDFSSTDGVVAIEFPDGAKYIVNRQTAANQMWFAAGASAWHYDWDADREQWLCDKDGHELVARISEAVSEKIGREVRLG